MSTSKTPAQPVRARRMPRAWAWTLRIAALLAVGTIGLHMPQSHVYQRSLLEDAPVIQLAWRSFSEDLTEAQLRKVVPTDLRCITQNRPDSLGSRVCYAAVARVNGVQALTLALFLTDGRLSQAVLHVPWWAHAPMARQLVADLGMPVAIQELTDIVPQRLVQWRLPNGSVQINRAPGLDPLAWSAVMWVPLQKAAEPAI